MAGNAFRRWFGGQPKPPQPPTGDDGLTQLFLAVDHRFSAIDEDVRTLDAQNPSATAVAHWPAVRDRFSKAIERYLWTTGNKVGTREPTAHDREFLTRELTDLSGALERFANDHRAVLMSARGARSGAEAKQQAARAAVHRATDLLAAPSTAPYLGLRSVIRVTDVLTRAVGRLDQARTIADTEEAATAVQEAAQAVTDAVDSAPGLAEDARRTIAAATTRLDAVRHRAEGLGDTRSALLREFSAACSRDLLDNDAVAAAQAREAEADLNEASRLLREGAPDQAVDQVAVARGHLDAADGAVNAVVDRLRVLRETKADPAGAAERTRFLLRDAQRLAVQTGQDLEWGSVLDAQHHRIERAAAELGPVHPDYWRYLQTLADVENMINGAIDRMRGRR